MPKTDIFIEDYSAKSFVVLGNTIIYKEDIKQLGGKFNKNLSGNRVGWIFPTSLRDSVTTWISSDDSVARKVESPGIQDFLKKILDNQKIILGNQEKILKIIRDEDSEEEEVQPRFLSRN